MSIKLTVEIEEGIASSKAVALVVSPEAMESGWVQEEYSRALTLSQSAHTSLRLIPVILRDAKLPGFLANRNSVDFRDEASFKTSVNRLVWRITGEKPEKTFNQGANDHVSPIQERDSQSTTSVDHTATTLQIVSFTAKERQPFPLLDIKLLNRVDLPAFIHELELVVLSSKTHFEELSTSPPVVSSHAYHLLIDPIQPKSVSRELSFVVEPKSADRFHVVVGATTGSMVPADKVLSLEIPDKLRADLTAELQRHQNPQLYRAKAVELEVQVKL